MLLERKQTRTVIDSRQEEVRDEGEVNRKFVQVDGLLGGESRSKATQE
jgi:hypothetical protein